MWKELGLDSAVLITGCVTLNNLILQDLRSCKCMCFEKTLNSKKKKSEIPVVQIMEDRLSDPLRHQGLKKIYGLCIECLSNK